MFERNDFNDLSTIPWIHTTFSSRESKISWSIVSNAAQRSNKTITAEDAESTAVNKSLKTLIKADYDEP